MFYKNYYYYSLRWMTQNIKILQKPRVIRNISQVHRYPLALLIVIRIYTENFSTNEIEPVSQKQVSM